MCRAPSRFSLCFFYETVYKSFNIQDNNNNALYMCSGEMTVCDVSVCLWILLK